MGPLSVVAWYLPIAVIGLQNLRLATHETCLCALHRPSQRGEGLPEGLVRSTIPTQKAKAQTNETPELLTHYVTQQCPVLYNREAVVLPRFQ